VAAALQIWSPTFCRAFDALPPHLQRAIEVKIDDMGTRLASFPHHRLTGRNESRMRVGDYRVLYECDIAAGRVLLLYVGHRRDIYKKS
jgi:mRNA-degrading endonuclease RelE of RelBE toxin-antitoxin system